jgi:hypothetical protein
MIAMAKKGLQVGWPVADHGEALLTDAIADEFQELGVTCVRLNFRLGAFGGTSTDFFSIFDEIVDRLTSRGIRIVGLVSNESFPGSQEDWIANNAEFQGGDGLNAYIGGLADTFDQLATHYVGSISDWEIWNEPNARDREPGPTTLAGSTFIFPSNFAALLTECHLRVHHLKKLDVRVVSGGLFGHVINGINLESSGAPYLDATYAIGLRPDGKFTWAIDTYGMLPIDAVGEHIYLDTENVTETINTYVTDIKDVIAKHEPGVEKAILMTEYGWEYGADRNPEREEAVRQALIEAIHTLQEHSTVEAACYFKHQDALGTLFGLYTLNGEQRAAYEAFKSG